MCVSPTFVSSYRVANRSVSISLLEKESNCVRGKNVCSMIKNHNWFVLVLQTCQKYSFQVTEIASPQYKLHK